MGDHFWEALLFKGPKGGYLPKKYSIFFFKKSLLNGEIGNVKKFQAPQNSDLVLTKPQSYSGVIGLKSLKIPQNALKSLKIP